ncbi:TIGR02679 family protein [Streptomyces sp. NPDC102365]|uniref:TIGR02679 family protein n=1 Tax=Streptomyces sp. NPDC102365 TaxID=3366162 RepID=UPI00380B6189
MAVTPVPEHDGPLGHDIDRDRLRRLLGDPELGWLIERIRLRMEREKPLTGPVSLSAPTDAQRAAAERLLGRLPRAGRSLTVRPEAVYAVLRRSAISPAGLAPAVTELTGTVTPLSERRRQETRAWDAAYAPLDTLGRQQPELAHWAAQLRKDGLVRRLARTPDAARTLLAETAQALRALPAHPAHPPTLLPVFATRALGRAHALDDGTPHATLVLSGIRALTGCPDGTGAEWRRAAWASAGVLKDAQSSTVLTLNLRGTPALDHMAEEGEPAVVTLRQLTLAPPRTAPAAVYICENPAVLATAADTYGSACPPLVCIQGQPSAAALTLLGRLHDNGSSLHYHGDFDWGGLRIATTLLDRVPWQPWRYTTVHYHSAAANTPATAPLTDTPTTAPWDPDLAPALTELGVRVEEETVLADLLADLAPRAPDGRVSHSAM